jgi:hypothetical protein
MQREVLRPEICLALLQVPMTCKTCAGSGRVCSRCTVVTIVWASAIAFMRGESTLTV